MLKPLVRFFEALDSWLYRPDRVIWGCLAICFLNLIADGSWLDWWHLSQQERIISTQEAELTRELSEMNDKLIRVRQPEFIARYVRENFDYAKRGDLIFVFADE